MRNGLGSFCLPRPSRIPHRALAHRALLPSLPAEATARAVLRALRLEVCHVLVELDALIGGQDLAYRGDPLLEALLEFGATRGHAGGVAALTPRTGRAVLAIRSVLPARTVRVELLALAALQVGELGLLVGREGDAAEQHALRATAAAAADAILLRATRALGALATIAALGASRGRDRQ